MSDNDFISTELDWEHPETLYSDTEPKQGKRHFGILRLYICHVTKMLREKGHFFTIPGVTGGNRNEKAPDGNMKLKSYKQGGDETLYVLVGNRTSSTGEPFQVVKQLPDRKYTNKDRLDWKEVVLPALLSGLSKAQRAKLSATGLPAAWSDVATGDSFVPDGEVEKVEIMTWGEFEGFDSVEAMKAAENEFFGQFSPNGVDHYPAENWHYAEGSVKEMLEYGASDFSKGHPPIKVANTYFLVRDGSPALDKAGKPVDVKAILREMVALIDEEQPGQKDGMLNQINELSY